MRPSKNILRKKRNKRRALRRRKQQESQGPKILTKKQLVRQLIRDRYHQMKYHKRVLNRGIVMGIAVPAHMLKE